MLFHLLLLVLRAKGIWFAASVPSLLLVLQVALQCKFVSGLRLNMSVVCPSAYHVKKGLSSQIRY